MQIILPIVCVLANISGVICMTALVRFIWMFPERNRICTVITAAVALAASVAAAVIMTVNIPDILFSPDVDVLAESVSQEYDTYLHFEEIQGYVSTVLLLFVPFAVLRVKRKIRVFLVELAFHTVAVSTFSFFSTALQLGTDDILKFMIEEVYNIVLYAALAAVFFLAMRKERALPLHAVIDSMPRWLFIAAIVFAVTAYFKTILFDSGGDSEALSRVYDVFWLISSIGIMVSAGYFVFKIFTLSYQQNQILKQMNDQQTHYEKALETDEQLRRFRHDYKNHMMVVTALLNSGRTQEASDYLEKVKVASGVAGRQFSTGSFIADAILNNKNSLAEEFTIHIGFDGRIPSEGIENSDFCTVFANLLDNAIEGTKRFDGDRYINVKSNVRNGMLTLSVYNPVNEIVIIKNNRIKTTKSDSRNHGIGLRNVERVAEKYNGHLLLSCDEKEFCADVSLKLDHPEEEN